MESLANFTHLSFGTQKKCFQRGVFGWFSDVYMFVATMQFQALIVASIGFDELHVHNELPSTIQLSSTNHTLRKFCQFYPSTGRVFVVWHAKNTLKGVVLGSLATCTCLWPQCSFQALIVVLICFHELFVHTELPSTIRL